LEVAAFPKEDLCGEAVTLSPFSWEKEIVAYVPDAIWPLSAVVSVSRITSAF
jgi:hypothetical protein